jgi:hypothetical protein
MHKKDQSSHIYDLDKKVEKNRAQNGRDKFCKTSCLYV